MSTAAAVQAKERPMIFTGHSVKAILAGTKWQTRRVITPQPEHKQIHQYRGKTIYEGEHRMWCWRHLVLENIWDFPNNEDRRKFALCCPHGIAGDRAWVKENWAPNYTGLDHRPVHYRCDLPDDKDEALSANHAFGLMRWRSSMFMPRWASRITLEITDVRVQRLQEITEEDAIAEGCKPEQFPSRWPNTTISLSARANYKVVWDRLNGKKYPWDLNHFVWAITFRKITR